MKKPSELLAGFRRRFVDVQVNTHLGIIVLRTAWKVNQNKRPEAVRRTCNG